MDRYRALEAENARLRELYENVTGNRQRFGWTINHLLECEESLRVAEEQLAGAVSECERLNDLLNEEINERARYAREAERLRNELADLTAGGRCDA